MKPPQAIPSPTSKVVGCLSVAAMLAVTASLAGCDASPEPGPPAGWADQLLPTEAEDINPDPHVVEVNLDARVATVTIRPGVTTQAWTYNGQVPGPLIRATRGDRLIVHFTNHLPEDSTIHWHGVRLPVEMDGVPMHSQPPVPPGGSFTYSFVVPDASLFWYHPHVDSATQVGDGLYGPLLVGDPQEPGDLGEPLVLVASDISVNAAGELGPSNSGGDVGTLFGREGDTVLVNGRVNPTVLARTGVRQRWRVVNAAKSRYFQLVLAGHTFVRVGGDGGLFNQAVTMDRVVLTPGQRADLLVIPNGQPGTDLPVRAVPFDRGYGTAYKRPEETLFTLHFVDGAATPPPAPATLNTVASLSIANALQRTLRLTGNTTVSPLVLGINDSTDTVFTAHLGDTEVWTITNTLAWAHPFHLHGFFFQVIPDKADIPAPEWSDTTNVPVDGTVRMAVKYDDRPGHWMFHCHILDHAEAGMMGMLELGP